MTPKRVLDALISGGMGAVEVAAACACSGLVIGVIGITGVGLAFSSLLSASPAACFRSLSSSR